MEEGWRLCEKISNGACHVNKRYNTESEWQNRTEWREWQSLSDGGNTHSLACPVRMVATIGLRHCEQKPRAQVCCLIGMAAFASEFP